MAEIVAVSLHWAWHIAHIENGILMYLIQILILDTHVGIGYKNKVNDAVARRCQIPTYVSVFLKF
jgi:hypothetical protein